MKKKLNVCFFSIDIVAAIGFFSSGSVGVPVAL